MTEIKGPRDQSYEEGRSRIYAEAQAQGTAWLPSPLRVAMFKVQGGNGLLSEAYAGETATTILQA
ncbi:hypothetical protein ACK83U_19345 (plasmid) [Rhizobium sp. WW22]|uniref:hypothetical protein n=1 Tax=unclassified Rhizobium TaxID=2613769 RepID=UPI000DDB26D6|nr:MULTISPECIES: hypothetical protein [unclassified Rhizobium]MBB3386661.1 hypothetical protein [Rhizobium sp. BK098]MBB3618365.1 hypothetical protein [Rhizobium sp. BK609]MBB3684022.1 hypothetical protein [Rhizobium sp. BK612]